MSLLGQWAAYPERRCAVRLPSKADRHCHENTTRKRTSVGLPSDLPAGSTGRRNLWEDAMTRERASAIQQSAISRRTLVQGLAVAAGATVAGTGGALAQQPAAPLGPPTHDHHPAARFRPARRADHLFLGPRHHRGRSVVQRPRPAQHGDQAALDRRAVGRRPGLERAGPLSPVERHSQQPADAMVGGRRPRQRVPHRRPTTRNGNSFDFQGRQLSCEHLTRRVVRYEHDGTVDRARRQFQRQEAQLAERRRRPSRTAATGSPIRPMAASSTRASRTPRAAPAMPAASSIRGSASRPASCRASASCRPTAIASIRAAASTSW